MMWDGRQQLIYVYMMWDGRQVVVKVNEVFLIRGDGYLLLQDAFWAVATSTVPGEIRARDALK